ncbi:hypothetical protein HDV00_011505 [Rhizophlyctis rosea]|nr:hypothetical protein HDV00_011505 [Rhizophlyctis rosea]
MLRLLPDFSDAAIVRTRDPAVLATANVVVDVGGEYVPERFKFDHHQRGFVETFDDAHDVKLSSAGLVYKHFGRQVVARVLRWTLEDPNLETVFLKVYEDFVLAFDAIDNGVSQYPSDLKPKYRDGTSIASRVGKLNPWWNEENVDYQERFMKAVEMCGTEFVQRVEYIGKSWLPAREIVQKALVDRLNVHPSGSIMILHRFCPWKEHLHLLEEETQVEEVKKPLYVLYQDDTAKQWRVQAVAVSPESFTSRKPLPEPWRGVRDQALSDLSGIPGCVFVHASGFIGGNQTQEGALEMARQALTFGDTNV